MKRPLKAPNKSITDEELKLLPYPVFGSPKIDGFRCLIDEIPKTSSMKPQPNPFVMKELSKPELCGLDGELAIGDPSDPNAFNISTGPLRRHYGEPDFHFYVFDQCLTGSDNYFDRWISKDYERFLNNYSRVIVLKQIALSKPSAVLQYEQACLEMGYEGAMIRTASGLYKQGRATFNEMNIFKRKPYEDTEGVIIGLAEQLTNLNPKFIDEMGLTKRSKNKENMVGAGTLGSFIMQGKEWEKPFNCSPGNLDHNERKYIWENPSEFLNKIGTYKYQKHGSIDAPRSPIFLRWYKSL